MIKVVYQVRHGYNGDFTDPVQKIKYYNLSDYPDIVNVIDRSGQVPDDELCSVSYMFESDLTDVEYDHPYMTDIDIDEVFVMLDIKSMISIIHPSS